MIHLPNLIVDLSLILASASVIGILFKFFKQPLVLGYIIAGIIVGPYFKFFPTVADLENIQIWADIGVIFLLFNLGLEFSFKRLFEEGPKIIIIALCGVGLTLLMGFLLGKLLGWDNMNSLFFGGMLSIASTTIIIRAFDELNVKTQKFTTIVTSILVVEDLVAVVLMVILSTVAISRDFSGSDLMISILKLFFFLILWFVSGIFFLPSLLKLLKNFLNEEILLVLSLSLCFLLVVFAMHSGFSPAFGAFIMGSILSETTKAERIEKIVKPIKDMFGAIFFVSVGMLLNPAMIAAHITPIVISVLILLIGKPLFITIGGLLTGIPIKTAVNTGMSLSQIGEFSFIIATLGLSLKVTEDYLYPIAVTVSVITTFTTPFMIKFSDGASKWLIKILPENWVRKIELYSSNVDRIGEISEWRQLMKSVLINALVFSVIIVTVILVGINFIQPFFWSYKYSRIFTAITIMFLISPFLWAIVFKRGDKELYKKLYARPAYRGPLFVLQVLRLALSVFYIGFVFDRLFSTYVALIGVLITVFLFAFFARKLQRLYSRIELRFLSNLNEKEHVKDREEGVLTPWDTHLSTFVINGSSPFVGKTLIESKIREKFGVNIAKIERDGLSINVPDRFERLFPKDVISVIGTDEQLNVFKDHVEKKEALNDIFRVKEEVKLTHFKIGKSSVLINKTIRSSNIRELTKGLVVGIERNGKRLLNPESDTVFLENDIVWIVGNEKRILIISRENRASSL